ncbi:hypothetical protein BJV92_001966 [Clostridium beijerinckii]|nr:hypothetical protein [Clostridium beijerinckii]NRU51377.1 hypothetical protein [Clostridium beijerinckii]
MSFLNFYLIKPYSWYTQSSVRGKRDGRMAIADSTSQV